MPVVRAADAVAHHLHGSTFTSYAAPATGSTELCAWRLDVAAGTAGVAHRVTREEVFLLLDGAITATLNGTSALMTAGDVLVVPAGAELRVDNDSAVPASAWVTTSVGLQAELPDGSRISPPWVR
jgi:mannose-6-phosphate isomerase-like protein (cupin superfamily)